jgi:hypothetical protein
VHASWTSGPVYNVQLEPNRTWIEMRLRRGGHDGSVWTRRDADGRGVTRICARFFQTTTVACDAVTTVTTLFSLGKRKREEREEKGREAGRSPETCEERKVHKSASHLVTASRQVMRFPHALTSRRALTFVL